MKITRTELETIVTFTPESLLGFIKTCGEVLGLTEEEINRVVVRSERGAERDVMRYGYKVANYYLNPDYIDPTTFGRDPRPTDRPSTATAAFTFTPWTTAPNPNDPPGGVTPGMVTSRDGVLIWCVDPARINETVFRFQNMAEAGHNPQASARHTRCRQATRNAPDEGWALWSPAGRLNSMAWDYATAVRWVRDGECPTVINSRR
jgi:hypothetical protein